MAFINQKEAKLAKGKKMIRNNTSETGHEIEKTTEGVGWCCIVKSIEDDEYVWVTFPEMYSLGPFGPMKGVVQTKVPVRDLTPVSDEVWDVAQQLDQLKPKKFQFLGNYYDIDDYANVMASRNEAQ